MPGETRYDEHDPNVTEEEFEQAEEELPEETEDFDEVDRDLGLEQQYDTKHGDGHTYNVEEAAEQGLTYTPPTDPATQPSDDPEGAEIAVGFAPSMEDAGPDVRELPEHVDDNDLELQEDVEEALANNSETADLADTIRVRVVDGVVVLAGTVVSDDDIGLLYDILIELPGVEDVDTDRLDVAD